MTSHDDTTHTTHDLEPVAVETHWPTTDPLDPHDPALAWLRSIDTHQEEQ